MNPDMKSISKDLLLKVLMHYMDMDLRRKVIEAVPKAYCDYYGGAPSHVVIQVGELAELTARANAREVSS